MTWVLATLAAVLIAYAALAGPLARRDISPAMFFTTVGLIVGPGLGLLDLEIGSHEVRLLAEVTLVLVLFSDASGISLDHLRRERDVPLRLLCLGLPLTILTGAAIGVALLPGVTLAEALVLSVALACTDAALGRVVVTDERVPSRVRQGLNVEGGLNDGLCVPLFLIAIAVAEADAGAVGGAGAIRLVVEELGWGAVAGVMAGLVGTVGLRFARRTETEGRRHWLRILALATASLSAGLAHGLGGSIFIGAFVAGFVFGVASRGLPPHVTALTDDAGELLNALTFTVFGAVILGVALRDLTWWAAAYAILSLVVVRGLPVAASMLGSHTALATVAFLGWFGPRGLASIVFGVLVIDEADLPHQRTLLLAIAVTVALSVFAHGLSARPLTDRYVRHLRSSEKVA